MSRELPFDPRAWAAPFEPAAWHDVVMRREALPHLGREVLLHAGPAFDGAPPEPVRQAAMQALVYEGIAADAVQARALLAMGEVTLQPAQDHGVVTPLAQVVSASMPLAAVGDGVRTAWAPLVEGPPPALRFGTLDAAALERLRAVADMGLRRLAPRLRANPVPLAPVIAAALSQGDECHARTGVANEALLAALDPSAGDRALLAGSPGFVLTVMMAAAAWRLVARGAGLAAVGGNGIHFGLRFHGETLWRRVPSMPPVGLRFPGQATTLALGAIGDSAVLDFCGLGGQALAAAPALLDEWRAVLPPDLLARRVAVCDPTTGLVDAARVLTAAVPPIVNLAVLDAAGATGLIGRGVFSPDLSLFQRDGAPR